MEREFCPADDRYKARVLSFGRSLWSESSVLRTIVTKRVFCPTQRTMLGWGFSSVWCLKYPLPMLEGVVRVTAALAWELMDWQAVQREVRVRAEVWGVS